MNAPSHSGTQCARDAVASIQQVLERGSADNGVDISAAAESLTIVSEILDIRPGELFTTPYPSAHHYELMVHAAHRRSAGEPLQYVLGRTWFDGVEIRVGPGVFIPRAETEFMMDWLASRVPLADANSANRPLGMDMCSGSGAIALALARRLPHWDIVAVERDDEALTWLTHNVAAQTQDGDKPVTVLHRDATNSEVMQDYRSAADFVITNPPYVPSAHTVGEDVARFEPPQAVFSGESGTDCIEGLLPVIGMVLKPGAVMVMEHDETHDEQVRQLIVDCGYFQDILTRNDLVGKPRFTTAYKRLDLP